MMSLMTKLGAALLVFYGLVVFAVWLGQRRLMYVPNTTRVPPASVGLPDVEELEIATPDGARLVSWRLKARPGKPTVLYFHGNAGGLANRALRAGRYRALGFGLLMMSYRGYSGSTGRPSEPDNLADAHLVYDRLIKDGIKPAEIVVYGKSLGSGIAVQLAAVKPVGALILDAPYTSMLDMAMRTYPFLPVRPLLADRYESSRYIARVTAPVLVLHGDRDEVIPSAMGESMFALANQPKRLAIFKNGGHTNLDEFGAVEAVANFLTEMRVTK